MQTITRQVNGFRQSQRTTDSAFHRELISPHKALQNPDKFNSIKGFLLHIQLILAETTIPDDLSYVPFNHAIDMSKSRGILANLQELERFFKQCVESNPLGDSFVSAVFDFLSRNLCRPLPSIPRHFMLLANPTPLKDSNSRLYLLVHRILILCLRVLPADRLEQWLSDIAIRFLICWLDSPDEEEHRSVQFLLDSICETYPQLKRLMISMMEQRLGLVLSEFASYPCIASYLSAITSYYESQNEIPNYAWFCSTVLSLFTSRFLPVFHDELEKLCTFMEDHFEDLPMKIAQFLLNHWPQTDSRKLSCFLASFKRVFRKLIVSSQNYECNPSFVELFQDQAELLSEQMHNWDKDIQEKAEEAIIRMPSIDQRFTGSFIPKNEGSEGE